MRSNVEVPAVVPVFGQSSLPWIDRSEQAQRQFQRPLCVTGGPEDAAMYRARLQAWPPLREFQLTPYYSGADGKTSRFLPLADSPGVVPQKATEELQFVVSSRMKSKKAQAGRFPHVSLHQQQAEISVVTNPGYCARNRRS